ncbi:hypothetical protein JIG36_34235 [Actinoplanes sp. LDG1-06]|uniref:Uncharacterized protein n=1 Tax=Paractinoplanes ovalisporus TaxID=2810368 RepID=A0ABS2AMG0_9ACTN|nr:hypothetical protein [Actinoplanes ovalisporus]MBM2620573.1 hypothetical protein [Actinoplanes ovalisporus]
MLDTLGNVGLALLRFILTTLLPLAFLVRVGYKGWLGGFVVKAPAKLIISGLATGIASVIGARAVAEYTDRCSRAQYAWPVFLATFLFAFVLLMFFARLWNLEWRWSQRFHRHRWPVVLRGVDGVAGVFVEVLAGLYIVGFVLASLNAIPGWLDALYPATKAVTAALPDWLNGTALWNDALEKISKATGFNGVPSNAPAVVCTDSAGIKNAGDAVIFSYVVIATLGPLAALLSFEAFTYAGQVTTLSPGTGPECPVCGGSGRNPSPLLFGSLCESCGGYGVDPTSGLIRGRALDMSIGRIVGAAILLGCGGCCCFCLAWTIPT